ncbi:MAG TPA: transcription-repair coupling factor [Acidimicrobiales bacterium]|nr:transcription-repair coupling factor [Acidimicrobiales bacterium]
MTGPLAHLVDLVVDDDALVSVAGRRAGIVAIPEPARAIALAALAETSERRPIVVAVPTSADAERLAHDLAIYVGEDHVDIFPAWETLPFERVSPSVETMGSRLRTLGHLREGGERSDKLFIVAPARALVQRLGPGAGDIDPIIVGPGDQLDSTSLVERLGAIGYRREYQVEHRGEFAVRGSIIDVFPSTADAPVRIDLWGDEVDRLSEFAIDDQRSTIAISEVHIFPCRELLPDDEVRARAEELIGKEPWGREQWERLANGHQFDGMESWLPWLVDDEEVLFDRVAADALVVLVEPQRLRDRAADIISEEADLAASLARTWDVEVGDDDEGLPRLHVGFDRLLSRCDAPVLTVTNAPDGPETPSMAAAGFDPVVGDGSRLVTQIKQMLDTGYRVIIGTEGVGSAERVHSLLVEHGLQAPIVELSARNLAQTGLRIVVAPIRRGVVLPHHKLAIAAETDVTGRRRLHRRARVRRRAANSIFEDLKAGDYVVHATHGVAKYEGMVTRAIGGVQRDYLLLAYRGDDKLYVPTDQIDVVRHYTGGDSPSLSRMGGADWQRTRSRVKSAVREIAQELVVLYQRRLATPGHAFMADTPWQHEFEASFPYEETPDQRHAIDDVKADMEKPQPMDRLLVGDVGFGKTEVALRAAFKAIQDGKQVAILVPTTLLAQQHHQTFSERFAGYPIRVEVLSRFLTTGQAKKVIVGVASGEVDLVIGTHRLLSEDLRFKRLGLLVVDEEQRFGVTHKEMIKKLQTGVDVLTLTATPIPRTLEMSLTGIRDLSLINTPPADRQPILTYVGEFDERAVGEAIRRELLREGQVFYVHNRVQDIDDVAAELRVLVPEARIAVAHGQMDESSLERVVLDFWDGDYDVLVCTTIIESGIDMPTVNTLVVDRADLLGLGQLHQLRGRVGRAGQRAYAYLFYPQGRELTEEAYERLKTIGESTELGSGFKIAMRDLEIRGAGNLLGPIQSGHIAAVGYDLYCQMVNEAIAELNGVDAEEPPEIALDLPVDANIPVDYIAREDLRLEAYRRLAAVTTTSEVDDIRSEWEDRYGPVPARAEALLVVGRLRALCLAVGISEVSVTKGTGFGGPSWIVKIGPVQLPASKVVRLERLYKGSTYRPEPKMLQLALPKKADVAGQLLAALVDLLPVVESAPVA